MRHHAPMPRLEVVNPLRPVHETEVGNRVDKILRPVDHARRHRISPELARALELLENLDRVGHIHRPVRRLRRRIAKFTNTGVARAGIVPTIGSLLRQPLRHLINLDAQGRIKPLEQSAQIGGHDAAADQHDIRIFNMGRGFHRQMTWLRTRLGASGRRQCQLFFNPSRMFQYLPLSLK